MTVPLPSPLLGGLDLGGTKIEATLFGAGLAPLASRRRPTPKTYALLLQTLTEEVRWLVAQGAAQVGLGTPGILDPATGRLTAANLAAHGQCLGADLRAACGLAVPVANDAQCFALSEAVGGAGQGVPRLLGLILGTGVGAGFCVQGQLDRGATGLGGEVGHFALPAAVMIAENLPLLRCGCGRTGCYETLLSGPGLVALHHHRSGQSLAPQDIPGDTLQVWHRLVAELLWTVQLTLDPDRIVLGGGLSNLPGVAGGLQTALGRLAYPGTRSPQITTAKYGDSSGTRGAALLTVARNLSPPLA